MTARDEETTSCNQHKFYELRYELAQHMPFYFYVKKYFVFVGNNLCKWLAY